MIETMKVVTLVASSKKKNEMLSSLRDAGLLHIKELKNTLSDDCTQCNKR